MFTFAYRVIRVLPILVLPVLLLVCCGKEAQQPFMQEGVSSNQKDDECDCSCCCENTDDRTSDDNDGRSDDDEARDADPDAEALQVSRATETLRERIRELIEEGLAGRSSVWG